MVNFYKAVIITQLCLWLDL